MLAICIDNHIVDPASQPDTFEFILFDDGSAVAQDRQVGIWGRIPLSIREEAGHSVPCLGGDRIC